MIRRGVLPALVRVITDGRQVIAEIDKAVNQWHFALIVCARKQLFGREDLVDQFFPAFTSAVETSTIGKS